MIFQKPNLLYALIAAAIPIIIHLINLRKRKKIYFSSIRFLKEIKQENKKKLKIKNLLILLSRILAIIFLVFAFAKPLIPNYKINKSNNLFIYIDNSQSMDVEFGKGNLLNIAKNKALAIVNSYPSTIKFYLLTNDFESQHLASFSANEIKYKIEKIIPSFKQKSINNIFSKMNSISDENNHLYYISDFQKESVKINKFKENSENNFTTFIPIKNENIQNISIDSLFIDKPIFLKDEKIKLNTIITNSSKREIKNEVLFLYLENKQKSQQYINLLPNETKLYSFVFLNNISQVISGNIKTHDSPITFDNNFFFTIRKSEKINIAVINNLSNNKAIEAVFKKDTLLFNYTSLELTNINHYKLLQQDFIILNEVPILTSGLENSLTSFLDNGGNLLITPPSDLINFNEYNKLLNILGVNTITKKRTINLKINKFDINHSIYENVFTEKPKEITYPFSKINYSLNNNILRTKIISLSNNEDFLNVYNIRKGSIYQFSSPIKENFNNFTKHALFVPTLLNIATNSILLKKPYYIVGYDKDIITKKKYNIDDKLIIKNNNIEILPTILRKNGVVVLETNNQITDHGIYSIISNNEMTDKIAYNYNRSESIISAISSKGLKQFISKNKIKNINVFSNDNISLKKIIKERVFGKEYWQISLLLSLFFFFLEILLIRIIKL